MSAVKIHYTQVPLGIAMKNIELHQKRELSEESLEQDKRNPKAMRPGRTSARNGAERVQSMSN